MVVWQDEIEEVDEEDVSDQEQEDGKRVKNYEFHAERPQEEILNQQIQQEFEEYQRSQQ